LPHAREPVAQSGLRLSCCSNSAPTMRQERASGACLFRALVSPRDGWPVKRLCRMSERQDISRAFVMLRVGNERSCKLVRGGTRSHTISVAPVSATFTGRSDSSTYSYGSTAAISITRARSPSPATPRRCRLIRRCGLRLLTARAVIRSTPPGCDVLVCSELHSR